MLSATTPRARQRRTSGRVSLEEGAFVLVALGDAVVRRPITDVSGGGLGIVLRDGDGVGVGSTLDRMRFVLPVGEPIVTSGTVRHLSRHAGGASLAGVELDGLSLLDRRRLSAWVRGRLGARAAPNRAGAGTAPRTAEVATADGRVRSLPVLHLLPDGCELGVGNYDRDLVEGIQLVALAIRLDGDTLLSAPAEITRSVSHRGRPIRARARWLRLDSATRRRLMHLLPREGGEPGT